MWHVVLRWHATEFAQTSAILEFYLWFWFRPHHCRQHVILHQSAKFYQNRTTLRRKNDIMGSLKSPCTTSYRSSIDTIALNCLVFEKIAFWHFGVKIQDGGSSTIYEVLIDDGRRRQIDDTPRLLHYCFHERHYVGRRQRLSVTDRSFFYRDTLHSDNVILMTFCTVHATINSGRHQSPCAQSLTNIFAPTNNILCYIWRVISFYIVLYSTAYVLIHCRSSTPQDIPKENVIQLEQIPQRTKVFAAFRSNGIRSGLIL